MRVPTLRDGAVTLRGHREDDVEGCLEQCRDPLSIRWTTVPVPYTREDAREFVRHAMPGGWETDQEWAFAIDVDGRYAGTVSLRNREDRRAEIAYGSHPWVRGTGHVHTALSLLLDWGFAERDLGCVIWWANVGNWASRKAAWRLGFSFDGTVRSWLPHRGELVDGWVGTLRRGEPRSPRTEWLDVPRLVGEEIVLRLHREEDAGRVEEACNDPETRHWLGGLPEPYTRETAERFVRDRSAGMAAGTDLHWVIADPADDRLLGVVSLMHLDGAQGEVGYWLHPDARGRGVMTRAVGLAVRHAFVAMEDGGLGLQRLRVLIAAGNVASRHVVEAVGFRPTGIERRAVAIEDGRDDLLGFDLLAEDPR